MNILKYTAGDHMNKCMTVSLIKSVASSPKQSDISYSKYIAKKKKTLVFLRKFFFFFL